MSYSIHVKKREGNDATEVRAQGLVPGVIYGPGRTSTSVSVSCVELEKLYNVAGESSLIDFAIDGDLDVVKVLIQEVQLHPVKGNIVHVDFRQIKMDEEMTTEVELNLVGESGAVKTLGGTLVKGSDTLEIKCLPKDLVSAIDVDLSVLNTFDDTIYVKDIKLPAGISLYDVQTGGMLVAKVSAPLSEDQLKAMEESQTVTVDQIEVEKKGKEEKEGEETATVEEKK